MLYIEGSTVAVHVSARAGTRRQRPDVLRQAQHTIKVISSFARHALSHGTANLSGSWKGLTYLTSPTSFLSRDLPSFSKYEVYIAKY